MLETRVRGTMTIMTVTDLHMEKTLHSNSPRVVLLVIQTSMGCFAFLYSSAACRWSLAEDTSSPLFCSTALSLLLSMLIQNLYMKTRLHSVNYLNYFKDFS